jgi:uncharacterized phage protein gp47/JayE
MANIPIPRSYNQIEADITDAFLSRTGLRALKSGSPLRSIIEAASQSDLRSSQDIFNLLNAISLDRAEKDALDLIGADEEIFRIQENASSGYVTISDTSFTKISTRIFQGTAAPIIGTVTLNVVDASNFPATGSIYIGRNTSNYEGPINYTTKINNGVYWSLTLATSTLRFHNLNESVVLAQGGDRFIGSGVLVQTPQGNTSDAVQFSTLYPSLIPDGETEIVNVTVVAKTPGLIGNVPSGAISSFVSAPFVGAIVTNPLPFTNATSIETDSAYRERIRLARQSRTRGTPLALRSFTIGVRSSEDNKQVTSASVVNRESYPSVLYIDDGTGYEEQTKGVAIEPLQDLAVGGEQYFQTAFKPVAKAYVETVFTAPYALFDGAKLAFAVNGVVSEHTFSKAEFKAINNASVYEISASINANINLTWSARTTKSGLGLAIFAKADKNEDIEWVSASSSDSNKILGFPTGRVDTMRLYKNDLLLSKDGKQALIQGRPFGLWNLLSGPQTLEISVDSTPSSVYVFTDADFIAAKTGFNTVGANTINAWVAVINAKIPGITAFNNLGALNLVSNLGTSARASIEILGGTLVTNNVFEVTSSFGVDNQYTLDRNLGQIRLKNSLLVGDRLSIGTRSTRAFLESKVLSPTTLLGTALLWFAIDSDSKVIKTGANVAATITFSIPLVKRWGYRLRLTSSIGAFSDIKLGDTMVLWDSAFPSQLKDVAYRITGIDAVNSSYVDIDINTMFFGRSGHTATTLSDGRILVVGGSSGSNLTGVTRSAEIFDPVTQTWSTVAPMNSARMFHTATLLPTGEVFVFGGTTGLGDSNAIAIGEIYDPIGNTWGLVSTIGAPTARYFHSANLLDTNKVLIIGGRLASGLETNTCFLYDFVGGTWSTTGNLLVARAHHTSETLNTTNVLAIMGENAGVTLLSAELYDKVGGTWSFTLNNLAYSRQGHASSILNDNTVLVSGGSLDSFNTLLPIYTSAVDIYDPGTNLWAAGTFLNNPRGYHTQTTTTNGDVIVGFGIYNTPNQKVELYDPMGGTWTVQPDPPETFDRVFAKAIGIVNQVLFIGGHDVNRTLDPIGSVQLFQKIIPIWSQPTPILTLPTISLLNGGLEVSRLNGLLTKTNIPSGVNYTASSFTEQLNNSSNLDFSYLGALASNYRTSKIRVNTNTFSIPTGDIGLSAANVDGQKLLLPVSDAIKNTVGHIASVESGNTEIGTPDFHVASIRGSLSSTKPSVEWAGATSSLLPKIHNQLVGLKAFYESLTIPRVGNNYLFYSQMINQQFSGGLIDTNIRKTPYKEFAVDDRVYYANPFSIGPEDDFVVAIDNDLISKRFPINMFRSLKSSSMTYGIQNAFKDAAVTPIQTIGVGFGLTYDFNDFAIYMAARIKTHSADITRRVLWRYFRLGPDGNNAQVNYVLPDTAGQSVQVRLIDTAEKATNVSIVLGSGPLKTGAKIKPSTKIGVCAISIVNGLATLNYVLGFSVSSGVRTANLTTLTLTLPGGITDHGLLVGNSIYFKSVSGSFTTGLYTITQRTATTIGFADIAPNVGATANPGTVSYDDAEVTLAGLSPAAVVGDYFRVDDPSGLPSNFKNQTIQILTLGNQFISGKMGGYVWTPSTIPVWYTLSAVESFKIFPALNQTASQIVTAVNALYNAPGSVVPIYGTVTGTGTGIITQSSADESLVYPTWFALKDGVNYVATTVLPPNVATDYEFIFKNPIEPSLTTDSDWENEIVRIVPITTRNVVNWLSTSAVSGLFTAAEIRSSDQARRVQIASNTAGSAGAIQIQGGAANAWTAPIIGSNLLVAGTYILATIPKAKVNGFFSDSWVSIDNTNVMPKNIITPMTTLSSITADGIFTFSALGTKLWDFVTPPSTNIVVHIEKQSKFVCVTDTFLGSGILDVSGVKEGDFVRIIPPASPTVGVPEIVSVNTGIFRVVRVQYPTAESPRGSFWIENSNVFEDVPCECDIQFLTSNSCLPGDVLQIGTNLWGNDNKGSWVIKNVGVSGGIPYTDFYTFQVDTTDRVCSPVVSGLPLGTQITLVQLLESLPARYIKKIIGIAPNVGDSETMNLKFETGSGFAEISEAAGSIVSALDKLAFSSDISQGIDGYKYSTGLLGEVNRVIYGDAQDPATYPGVAAAGTQVNIQGPLIKRISLALSARIKSGFSRAEIAERIKSIVASTINQSLLGQSIPISSIVAAASRVLGVISIAIISPLYNTVNDLISVQPFEKALIINPDDVSVSFVGD